MSKKWGSGKKKWFSYEKWYKYKIIIALLIRYYIDFHTDKNKNTHHWYPWLLIRTL